MAKNTAGKLLVGLTTSAASTRAMSAGSVASTGDDYRMFDAKGIEVDSAPCDFVVNFDEAGPLCYLEAPTLKCHFFKEGPRCRSRFVFSDRQTTDFHKVFDETTTRVINLVGSTWTEGLTLSKACYRCCEQFQGARYLAALNIQ